MELEILFCTNSKVRIRKMFLMLSCVCFQSNKLSIFFFFLHLALTLGQSMVWLRFNFVFASTIKQLFYRVRVHPNTLYPWGEKNINSSRESNPSLLNNKHALDLLASLRNYLEQLNSSFPKKLQIKIMKSEWEIGSQLLKQWTHSPNKFPLGPRLSHFLSVFKVMQTNFSQRRPTRSFVRSFVRP